MGSTKNKSIYFQADDNHMYKYNSFNKNVENNLMKF